MDTKIAQKRIDDLSAAMLAKGMREPEAVLRIASNSEPSLHVKWKSGISRSLFEGEKTKFFHGALSAILIEAAAFIADQPDADQTKLRDFMSALGSVIDIGREHGIDADYLNPLVASMKKLSENAITDQRAA